MGIDVESWGRNVGFQSLAVTNSAQALTVPDGAQIAVMTVDTNNIMWRDDGTDPTTTVGIRMTTTDQPFVYRGGNLKSFKAIEVTGAPILNIAYYGEKPLSNT
jgi:hypothetical protein